MSTEGRQKWVWVLGSLCVLLVAGYLGVPVALEALGRSLIQHDPLRQADAILVLQGDDEIGSRVSHAVRLFKDGYAPLLVISGQPVMWETHSAYIMTRQALAMGVPGDRIMAVRHEADSTKEEAAAVLPELTRREVKSVILVTSSFHTRRAKRVFQAGPGGDRFEWMVSPAQDRYFSPDRWWTRRRDARTFFYEGTKTLWYLIAE
ncbi:MAG: YdcF family protein [Nitrospirae bacterium]|nr:YdcF family protein [Nitrospirota bacterium]